MTTISSLRLASTLRQVLLLAVAMTSLADAMDVRGASDSPYVHLHSIGSSGSGPAEFLFPYDVDVRESLLYVADSHNNRVQVLTLEGEFVRAWGSTGSADGEFRRNRGLAVDRRASVVGRVYVTDAKNDRVQRFAPDGTHELSMGSIGDQPEQFFRPRGIAVAPDGQVVICDADNHRVKVHRPDLGLVRVFGGLGILPGFFRSPFDVAVSSGAHVYVVDSFNARVQVFDLTGAFLFAFGGYGDGDGQFVVPKAIAIGPDGTVFVADTGDSDLQVDRIQRFDGEGAFLQAFGRFGQGPGELDFVTGLAVDDEGRLYAADSGNDRVSVWGPASVEVERRTPSSLKGAWR